MQRWSLITGVGGQIAAPLALAPQRDEVAV